MVGKIKKVKNFMGRGVASNDSGLVPKEFGGMGVYYGAAMKNPMGRLRSDTPGYRPVNRKQMGIPPKSVV
jgi:hypothetical protein